MRVISGQCHCRNLVYRLDWPACDGPLMARACGCTFCRKHGGVYTSHPEARLSARVVDADCLNIYTFGTRTAEFYICTRCGAVPFVTSTIQGVRYAVVNVNTFENVDASGLDTSATDFDDEDIEERLERRKRNWIAAVEIEFGPASRAES
jgi:hypothetical protein